MAKREFDQQALDADALLKQLGVKGGGDTAGVGLDAPTSNTMPIDASPRTSVADPLAPAAPAPKAGAQPSVFQGFTPTHAMEGFEFGREQNTGKSAKDAFAMLANQAPQPPLNDKAALGQWFNQYILPGMNELGHGAQAAEGDKFQFKNWQGNFDVDFGRGAGAEGGALSWQAEGADDATRQMYGEGSTTPRPQFQSAAVPAGDGTDPMQEILAEIQALQSGGQSPMDAKALMALLQDGQQVS